MEDIDRRLERLLQLAAIQEQGWERRSCLEMALEMSTDDMLATLSEREFTIGAVAMTIIRKLTTALLRLARRFRRRDGLMIIDSRLYTVFNALAQQREAEMELEEFSLYHDFLLSTLQSRLQEIEEIERELRGQHQVGSHVKMFQGRLAQDEVLELAKSSRDPELQP